MDLHQWLDQPENFGRAIWLSEQVGRSKAAVSLWRTEGVPMPLMQRISDLCPGVTVDAMLHHALRCKTTDKEAA